MKLIISLSGKDELRDMIALGADEFFCGLNTGRSSITTNRRELPAANINSLKEFRDILDVCKENNVPISVTVNKIFYTNNEISKTTRLIEKLTDLNVDAIMVSDPGLIRYIFENNLDEHIDVHLSSVANVFNKKSIEFYSSYNFSRIILPRHLSLSEIKSFKKAFPHIEFEAFILNWNCMNIDGLCNTQHDLTSHDSPFIISNQCCLDYDIGIVLEDPVTNKDNLLNTIKDRFRDVEMKSRTACGACFIPGLKNMGIRHLKILDRLLSKQDKIRSLTFIKGCLNILKESDDIENYKYEVKKLYRKVFNRDCNKNCYF